MNRTYSGLRTTTESWSNCASPVSTAGTFVSVGVRHEPHEPSPGRPDRARSRNFPVDILRAARSVRGRVWPAIAACRSAEGVLNVRRALEVSPQPGEGRDEAYAHVRAALGRPVEYRRQHAHEHLHRSAGLHRQSAAGCADATVRESVPGALASTAGARRGPVRSSDALRAA